MSKKDRDFFDRHWRQWCAKNPPPKKWTGTLKEWAEFEMPTIGWFGRLLYEVSMRF
jgi:hypothetical protein